MAVAPLGGSSRRAQERVSLRLLQGGRPAGPRGTARHARRETGSALERGPELRRSRIDHPAARVAEAQRSAAVIARSERAAVHRSVILERRRRTAAAAIGVLAIVLLALPLRAFAAETADGRVTPGAAPAGLQPGLTYAVTQGETIRSIAQQIPGANLTLVERQLVAELGSSNLVVGEHFVAP